MPKSPAVWLFLGLTVFYTALTRGHFWSTDEMAVYQQTQSLWERGDLAIAPINNTIPGRGGRYYAPYGAGQSVLALPLYALGKTVHAALDAAGAEEWKRALAGPRIAGGPGVVWGGEVEIFFVNLLNSIMVAALVSRFFLFSIRLGAGPRWALLAAALLGFASHAAGFSAGFFQHPSEAFFLLSMFYFLFEDSQDPSSRARLYAGLCGGMMVLVRVSTTVFLPTLTLYLLWNVWRRMPEPRRPDFVGGAKQVLLFLLPVGAGLALAGAANYSKFGEFSLQGSYAKLVPFNTPPLVGLYGYLFSPGESIFLFSPLLALAPVYFQPFSRRYRAETIAILVMALSYLGLYSHAYLWHGQWAFGPRYLLAAVPLLMLPLGRWMQEMTRAAWASVAALAALGLFIEVLHVAINVSYVYYREGYASFVPPYGFLFLPEACQIATHFRALMAGDDRVDMWLVTLFRQAGTLQLTVVCLLLGGVTAFCGRQLMARIEAAQKRD